MYQASRQPPPSRSHSEYRQVYSVRPADESYHLGFIYQPSLGSSGSTTLTGTWPSPQQGPVNAQDGLEGSYIQMYSTPIVLLCASL